LWCFKEALSSTQIVHFLVFKTNRIEKKETESVDDSILSTQSNNFFNSIFAKHQDNGKAENALGELFSSEPLKEELLEFTRIIRTGNLDAVEKSSEREYLYRK